MTIYSGYLLLLSHESWLFQHVLNHSLVCYRHNFDVLLFYQKLILTTVERSPANLLQGNSVLWFVQRPPIGNNGWNMKVYCVLINVKLHGLCSELWYKDSFIPRSHPNVKKVIILIEFLPMCVRKPLSIQLLVFKNDHWNISEY